MKLASYGVFMKTFIITCITALSFLPLAVAIDPQAELILRQIEQNQRNQKNQQQEQKTPVDLSTDSGRKVYLKENPRYAHQYDGTDGPRKLQRDADDLAAHDSQTGSTAAGSLYDSLKLSNPSLTKDSLSRMSSTDVRSLFYNKFRQEGKSMSEAKELAASVAIPDNR